MIVHSPSSRGRRIAPQRQCHPSDRQAVRPHIASSTNIDAGSEDMKPISLTLHGAIDYLAVLIFVAAPAIIGLSGWPAVLSYALAGIHLLMTLLTDFPAGAIKLVAVALHNWVERTVGPVLIILAFVPLNGATQNAQIFFGIMGVVILTVERLTAYRSITEAK